MERSFAREAEVAEARHGNEVINTCENFLAGIFMHSAVPAYINIWCIID